jgi:hypothetical protein
LHTLCPDGIRTPALHYRDRENITTVLKKFPM